MDLNLGLQHKQSIALSTSATEVLYGGAAFGGKSHLMRIVAIFWCSMIPGLQVYIFRRKFPDLHKNHMEGPTSFPVLLAPWVDNKKAKINYSSPGEIEFWNGSKIFLCHAQYEKDVNSYLGAEIHLLLIDELTTFTEKMYRMLRSRVRIGSFKIPLQYKHLFPRILTGSNPGSIGHNWVKRSFVKYNKPFGIRRAAKKDGGMLRQYIPALMQDNPIGMENDPDYENKLEGLGNAELIKAYKGGIWDIMAGGMFDDIWVGNEHILILEPFVIPDSWYIDRSFDWGSSKPFSVGWWAESDGTEAVMRDGTIRCWPRGTLFRIGEWYGWNGNENEGLKMPDASIAKEIIRLEKLMNIHNRVQPGPADSSIFDTSNNGYSIEKEMKSAGVRWIKANKAPGTRIQGWSLMRSRLIASTKFPMEDPGLYTFNTCYDGFIRTIPSLPRDENKSEDVDTDAEDHTGDEVRYRVLGKKPAEMIVKDVVGL